MAFAIHQHESAGGIHVFLPAPPTSWTPSPTSAPTSSLQIVTECHQQGFQTKSSSTPPQATLSQALLKPVMLKTKHKNCPIHFECVLLPKKYPLCFDLQMEVLWSLKWYLKSYLVSSFLHGKLGTTAESKMIRNKAKNRKRPAWLCIILQYGFYIVSGKILSQSIGCKQHIHFVSLSTPLPTLSPLKYLLVVLLAKRLGNYAIISMNLSRPGGKLLPPTPG